MKTQDNAKQWEALANEAISDAQHWKNECRKMQSERAALVAVAEKANRLLDDVESMARLLARHADISIQGGIIESNIKASKEAIANLAAVRGGKANQ